MILLAEQDRRRWDAGLIGRGFAHLDQARSATALTALHIEAAIASVHAAAQAFDRTDWSMLAHYYVLLDDLKPTPVVRLNAAIAVGYAEGPRVGLARLDAIDPSPRLGRYAFYHAARGDLLLRLGRPGDAGAAFEQALNCPLNRAEREHLTRRLRACAV